MRISCDPLASRKEKTQKAPHSKTGNPFCSSSRSPDTSRPHSFHGEKEKEREYDEEEEEEDASELPSASRKKKKNKLNLQVSAAVTSGRPAAPSAAQHLETRFDPERSTLRFTAPAHGQKRESRGSGESARGFSKLSAKKFLNAEISLSNLLGFRTF